MKSRKSKSIIILIAAVIIIYAAEILFSLDSSAFTVRLSNFSEKITREKRSRFLLSSTGKGFSIINTGSQKVIGKYRIKNRTRIELITGDIKYPDSKKPGSKYLRDTIFLNLKSEKIKSISDQFKRSKNPLNDIELYVFKIISKKIIGIPLLPAERILKSRAGDCTEHTILSVAILRSLEIPARAVMGVYLADEFLGTKNVFVYHMWAEAYHGGKWQLIDATRPGNRFLNRYIGFSLHSLRTEMPLSYLRAISAIKDLEIMHAPPSGK